MTMTAILYHSSCPDGFGSAWVAQKCLPDPVLVPMSYGDPVPDEVDDQLVFVLDFCFPPDQLVELCERADRVRILDHHYSALGYLNDTEAPISVYGDFAEMPEVLPEHWAVLNQEHSGVGLTQEWFGFHRDWLDNIEDRDLWRFALPDTKDVFAAVTAMPYAIEAWDQLDAAGIADMVMSGVAINAYRDQLIDAAVDSAWHLDIPGLGSLPTAPCMYAIGSDVAGKLAEQTALGVGSYFMMKENSVRVGLRARNGGPNVADMAARFGGGGHPAASGFEVSREVFESWSL
jgi:hypothetical protein